MFRSRSWFSSPSLWKPKNPHSTEYLKYLHSILQKNQNVTEQNKALLVEALRSIAEILIWGDQNDPGVFDFFLEKNMLSYFLKIMKQKCGSYVCVQLLQTLNILFENIRNQTSIYYLLSNNHVNSIIEHKFDFSDEEVMAYYISFLKTLSLKLNSQTIHFFYNEHTLSFPLYTEAIAFLSNPESMVRIAVRTLTLNVFRVPDKSMLTFIKNKTAAPYFSNLVNFISEHMLQIDKMIKDCENDHGKKLRLDDLIAEHLDHLHYVNDILLLGIEELNVLLVDSILRDFVGVVIEALEKSEKSSKISRILSLYIFTQLFLIISNKILLKDIAEKLEKINLIDFIDSSETDYLSFFALALLIAMETRPNQATKPLLKIIQTAVTTQKTRLATLSLATQLLRMETLQDCDLATLESHREENIQTLQNYFKSEEFFLEMFEDEWENSLKPVNLESLLSDGVMLLPPVSGPLSGVGIERRGVAGETERTRRCMRIYFMLRSLSLKLRNEEEKFLPLKNIHRNTVALEQCIDLTNSDLLACTVCMTTQKLRRFLVVDSFQFILVEPSGKRMGWGVVRFVGYLQDLEALGDAADSRALLITIKSSPIQKSNQPILSAKFIFDDHIRCMAARQRLLKGRHRAREKKLNMIHHLLNDSAKYSPPTNLKAINRYRNSVPGRPVLTNQIDMAPGLSEDLLSPEVAESSFINGFVV